MEGNVCFVNDRGLHFISMDQQETQKLIDLIEELKEVRKQNTQYKFIISFNDRPELQCEDVWLEMGVRRRGNY